MKQKTIFLILLFSLTLNCCQSQNKNGQLKISDLNFKSIFGMTTNEPTNTYCLLGSGYFRTPRSANSDSLIISWMKVHPNAIVVPVSSFGPTESKVKDSKMVYCWVIENNDTLNNFLIKNGCFPGGTMIRPKTWDEMEESEKELYNEVGEKPDVKVYVDKKTYDSFIEQIKSAELYAREKKLGIWLEESEE